jgi:hypothetical protein
MKTAKALLVIAAIGLLCNCRRKGANVEDGRHEVLQTPGTVMAKTSNGRDAQPANASLSVWRYHSEGGPIVVRIKYTNTTKTKYRYVSWAGSPESQYFKAVLKMPDGGIREAQLRNGDEYMCGSFAQVTEVNPGCEIEWLYVLTSAALEARGRFLHPEHWSFDPGPYEVSVSSKAPEVVFVGTIVPKLNTPAISFHVIPGTNNPPLILERKPDWGREEKILDICVDRKRYRCLMSDVQKGDRLRREKAAYTLYAMTQIDVADHGKIIDLWNRSVAQYKPFTFGQYGDETKQMLGCLGGILKKMNTKEARELLDKRSEDLKKAAVFIGGG